MKTMTRHTARLLHINTREETHGEEKIKAQDLKLRFRTHCAFLDDVAPGLRQALYRPPELPPAKTADQLFDGRDRLEVPATLPRFAEVTSVKPTTDMIGRLAVIEWGIGEPMEFDCARAKKFEIDILPEGELVEVTYTLAVYPTPEQVANLFGKLGTDIELELLDGSDTPPLTQASLLSGSGEAKPETAEAEA